MRNRSGPEKRRLFLLYPSSVCGVLSLQWHKAACSKAETMDNAMIVKVLDELFSLIDRFLYLTWENLTLTYIPLISKLQQSSRPHSSRS